MAPAAGDSGVGAGVDEPPHRVVPVYRGGHGEDVAGALDVGPVQRGGIEQPASGVDHAVIDVVTPGHSGAKEVVVPDVADESLGLQIVDTNGVGIGPQHDSHLMAGANQLPGDMGAEESVRADD